MVFPDRIIKELERDREYKEKTQPHQLHWNYFKNAGPVK